MVDELAGLSERQRVILEYVVEDYLAGGYPVGSKALTARRRMRVSSSTVRYELAELEERGYLTHPHTSAGRVPTDQGYRFYVDRLLGSLAPKPADLPLDLSGVRNEVDAALETTIAALTQVTHLLALATAPSLETTVVRHVEVLVLQPQVVVVVIITSTGGVTKRLFVFGEPVDPGLAAWAHEYLNEQVAGLNLGARLLRNRFDDPSLPAREREFLAVIEPAFRSTTSRPGVCNVCAASVGAETATPARPAPIINPRRETVIGRPPSRDAVPPCRSRRAPRLASHGWESGRYSRRHCRSRPANGRRCAASRASRRSRDCRSRS